MRYVSNSQRSEGSTTFVILRLASAMIAERWRPSASSNALRAAFFSAGVQCTYLMNCSGDSIDVSTSGAGIDCCDEKHLDNNPRVSPLQRVGQIKDSTGGLLGARCSISKLIGDYDLVCFFLRRKRTNSRCLCGLAHFVYDKPGAIAGCVLKRGDGAR